MHAFTFAVFIKSATLRNIKNVPRISFSLTDLFFSDDANHLPNTMVHRCKNYFSFFNRLYFSYLVATTLSKVAFFVPYTFLYNMMITRGQTRATASLTLSLAGIGSIVSRLLVGFIGDFKCCHRIYYYIFSMLFSGAITMACVHFKEDWQFLMYGFMYGFSAGEFD